MPLVIHRNTIIAHHLVISGYGHWLPNDVRGSGSPEIRAPKFRDLGSIHFGRKPKQPPRGELRSFCREAEGRLEHNVLWFDDDARGRIGLTVGRVVRDRGYTVWACAVLRDHIHLCIRIHRDDYDKMWEEITGAARAALASANSALVGHPIWADRPYSRYCKSTADVWRVIKYIEGNPAKHGLPPQTWDFVREYDNWPWNKDGRAPR